MPAGGGGVTVQTVCAPVQPSEQSFVSELFHAISQPLTALECGLEVSLGRDKTAAELRARIETALASTKLLHQRLLEARALQDAGDPGDTRVPVDIEEVLLQVREDFLPLAESAHVGLSVKSDRVQVRGNEARLRNGLFHLFEFLLRITASHRTMEIHAERTSLSVLRLSFSNYEFANAGQLESTQAAEFSDVCLRIAQRTFQGAGGDLVLMRNQGGQVSGYACLMLTN